MINGDLDSEAIAQVIMVLFWGLNILIFLNMKVNIDEFSSVFEAILKGQFSVRKRKENKR